MSNILAQMEAYTRQVVERCKQEIPLNGMKALASMQPRPIDLSSVLREEENVSLIAEIKRSAPKLTTPIENFDLLMIKSRFEASGARAISIATNRKYYQSDVADLTLLTQNTNIPVIRQDIIFDEYQIFEARAAGADSLTLITTLLEPDDLRNLLSLTQRNRMTALIQVQDEAETRLALQFEPRVIAISNRNLHDFTIDLDRTLRLRELIPPHILVVSQGGLHSAEDVAYVYQADIDAIVVGQALLSAPDTANAIRELFKLTSHRL